MSNKYYTKPEGVMKKTPNRWKEHLLDVLFIIPMWKQMWAVRNHPSFNFVVWAVISLFFTGLGVVIALQYPPVFTIPMGYAIHTFFNYLFYSGEQATIEHQVANKHLYDEDFKLKEIKPK